MLWIVTFTSHGLDDGDILALRKRNVKVVAMNEVARGPMDYYGEWEKDGKFKAMGPPTRLASPPTYLGVITR